MCTFLSNQMVNNKMGDINLKFQVDLKDKLLNDIYLFI